MTPTSVEPALRGGYAEFHYLAPDSLLLPVPSSLGAVDATLFNPVGAGLRWGADLPRSGSEDVVAVLGPGIRGLAAVAAAREAGARRVLVTGRGERDRPRLEAARDFGADEVVDVATDDPVKAIRALSGGEGATVVVDVTANAPGALAQAVDMAAPGARIVFAGVRNSTLRFRSWNGWCRPSTSSGGASGGAWGSRCGTASRSPCPRSPDRLHHHHVGNLLRRLQGQGLLVPGVDAVAAQLQPRGPFAAAELDAAVGDQIEHRHRFGGAGGVL